MFQINNWSPSQLKPAYSFNIWIKLDFEGAPTYHDDPLIGRDNSDFFKVEDVFALWFNTKTSFRVYVYALKGYDEFFSR